MPGPGRRFEPGNRANPAGRPRVGTSLAEAIRERAGEDGGPLVDRLFEIALGSDRRLGLQAIELLLIRGFGRPIDTQVTLDAASLREIPTEDLEVALRVAQKLSAA